MERLLIAAIVFCLAVAGVMGCLFFNMTRENREAAQELALIEQQVLRTIIPETPCPTPTPAAATPAPEETQESAQEEIELEAPEPASGTKNAP